MAISWAKLMGMEPMRYEKSGGSAPPPTDYVGAAREQGRQNIDAARVGAALNRVNQVTPYGTVTYRRAGQGGGGQMPPSQLPRSSAPGSNQYRPGGGSGIVYEGNPVNARVSADGVVSARGGRIPQGTLVGLPGGQQAVTGTGRNVPGDTFTEAFVRNSFGQMGIPYIGNDGQLTGGAQPDTYDASQDQWEQVTELSPGQQAIFDSTQGNQLALSQLAGSRAEQLRGQKPLGEYNPGDFGAQRDQVSDTLYRAGAKYLDPQFQREDEAQRTRLLNSGLTQGSEAWNNAMSDFTQKKESAYADLRDRAVLAGGQEQSRLLSDALRGRQQQVTERQIPLEETLALMGSLGGSGGGMAPGAIPQVGGPQAAPYMDAVSSQQAENMNYYNQDQARRQQSQSNTMAVLGMLATAY